MPKILYICPHLSTGGQPQYTLKQIECFHKENEIFLIEYANLSDIYTIQRDRIKNILGNKYFVLQEDKSLIFELINQINPEVIHFQEIPEFFMADEIAAKIFNKERKYKIICTTHSSNTNPEHIIHIPDKFVLVSEWSKQQFKQRLGIDVDLDIWEYPIQNLKKINKKHAQEKLGFAQNYKHVLNIGLFTPGKNQGEIFNIARILKDEKIKFHFVGNQAVNFQEYWVNFQ